MSYKLYIQDNSCYLINNDDNLQYEGHAKDVLHRRRYTTDTDFAFTGLNYWDVNLTIPYADLQDKNGDPWSNTYATAQDFSDYLDTVLGKSSPQVSGNVKEVASLSDLPAPIAGVITLDSDTAYLFKSESFDLNGNRIVGKNNTAILGSTSETSKITSTGLGSGIPLFTTSFTTPIQNITFENIDTCFSINGDNTVALDWDKCNIVNCPNIGEIANCSNWILTNSAFLNSKGLKFDGEIGTIGISNSLFVGDGLAGSIIEIKSTANITRRFRPIYSSFVVNGSNIGIDVNDSATILTESYILDTINFSGNGIYQTGVLSDSNKSLFSNCVGIENTSVNGQLYMRSNLTPTSILNTSDFFKVTGITIPSPDNSKFDHSDNRLTCKAIIERKYLITCTLSFSTSNNNVCEFGFFDSKLNDIRTPSITTSTANSSGRQEGVTFSCVVQYGFDNYLEIHCRNTTGSNNITVTDMNFIISEIK